MGQSTAADHLTISDSALGFAVNNAIAATPFISVGTNYQQSTLVNLLNVPVTFDGVL